jgi:hypothetical protein
MIGVDCFKGVGEFAEPIGLADALQELDVFFELAVGVSSLLKVDARGLLLPSTMG